MSERTINVVFCKICAEKFTDMEGHVPRVLRCGHTFCESCIEKLKTPRKRLYRSRSNFGNVSTTGSSVSCPRCKDKTTLNAYSHRYITTPSKNYSLLDLIEGAFETQKKQVCPDHEDYVLDMFCHDDSQAICLNCAIYGDHKTHCYSRLSEFCDHKKTSVKYQIDSAECLMRDCQGLQKQVEARKKELEKKMNKFRESVISMFTFIQREIKEILDATLESVLDDLERWSKSQMIFLDENLAQLEVNDLESLKDKMKSFLKNASEREIAEETALPNDMQACLDEVPARKLRTQHKYEIQIDSWKHITETIKDLMNGWNCQVTEKGKVTTDVISSVIEKHSPSIESSMRVLFDENEAVPNVDSPFEGIDFTHKIP